MGWDVEVENFLVGCGVESLMASGFFKSGARWIVVAGALWGWSAAADVTLAQAGGAASNSGSATPAAGSEQNRDAGNRGDRGDRGDLNRRGRGRFGGNGDRERGGRGPEGGGRENSSSSNNAAAAKPTPAPATPATPELSEADRIRAWAKDIIQKHDKNGDMMLQESEWEGLGQSTKADTNGDKVITLDELIAFASRKPGTPVATGSSAAAPAATPSGSPSGDAKTASGGSATEASGKIVKTSSHGSTGAKSAKDSAKSYRFKTAKERLPAGLPAWFTAKDTNGDGQVEMSEYSHSWTESQAADFKRYDKDNDGIITAEEAMKK
jgi:hypothetical protein